MATFTMQITSRLFIVLAAIAVTCVSGRRDLRELASTETENWVPQVPDAIKVPAGYKLHLNLFGEGHQYYRYNGSSWVQFSAKASLYDAEGKEIGQHFYLPHLDALGGQPSWKTQPSKAVPYSRVTAKAVVKISTDPQSIPWILLNATEVTATSSHIPASQNDYRTLLLPYGLFWRCSVCATVQHFRRACTALHIRCNNRPRQKVGIQLLLRILCKRVLNQSVISNFIENQ